MFFNYLTLFSALLISSVAIFYSVAGLATIFAASALSVIVMGTALEVGKLVVAVWLHKHWNHAVWWLKTYLTASVVVLMFITSMGIFGYLSKSHVEQTAASSEGVATIERIEADIARQEAIIARAEDKIRGYENNGSGADLSLQTQIDREQDRIDGAYERIQPQVDRQLDIIASEEQKIEERLLPYQQRIADIDALLGQLRDFITNGEIRKAQGLVGAAQDGQYGPKTAARFEQFNATQEAKRQEALGLIREIRAAENPAILAAQQTIEQLNETVRNEIAESNKLIDRLRSQLGQASQQNIGELIDIEQQKISAANDELDTLTEEKFVLETQQRKLEAEVGPIKYIAEFVYGDDADTNLLETAVRWVIIVIIIVFDPLAVLLLIAAQHSFDRTREERKLKKLEEAEEAKQKTAEPPPPEEPPQPERPLEKDIGDPIEEMIPYAPAIGVTYAFSSDAYEGLNENKHHDPEDLLSVYNDDRLATKHDMATDWDEEKNVEEVIETMEDLDVAEEDLDEPEPSIKEVEQIVDMPVDEEEAEEPQAPKTEPNQEILDMLHSLQANQHQVLDELTKRKQILSQIRNKKD